MAFNMSDGDEGAPMAEINVTPLVDVMLVLLIVFMITMPVLTHSVPIDLPTTSKKQEEKPKQDTKPIIITVDKDGGYYIGADSTRVDLDAVKSKLEEVAKNDAKLEDGKKTVVGISADKEVAYDNVLQVISVAREAKLEKIGFVTKDEQEEKK